MAEQEKCRDGPRQSKGERVIAKLRTDHLHIEEKKSLNELCFDYEDLFFLTGDKLSCTNAARHDIQLEPGVTAINTRPYGLPESQREEIDRQVKQLLEERFIAKSDSDGTALLLVPKKVGPDRKRKYRLVVDFCKLNENNCGGVLNPYLLLLKYWTSCVSLSILHA